MSKRGTAFGRMTRDPELTRLASGTQICKGCVACDFGYGEKKDTLFEEFVAFGKTAELIAQYMPKGDLVLLYGEDQEDRWEDKTTGDKRTKRKLKVDGFDFVPGQKKREQAQEQEPEISADDPGSVPF